MRTRLKQFACRHDWKLSRFQALGSTSPSYQCAKCGKYHFTDERPRRLHRRFRWDLFAATVGLVILFAVCEHFDWFLP